MKQLQHFLLAFTFLFIGATVHGQDKPVSSPAETIEKYKALIKETMEKSKLVGVGAALILGDSLVWKEGFGYADKENKIPFTMKSTMNIGSITKPITALGIMQLHEKGLLNIDKPLLDYLPQFSIKTRGADLREITVRSVISHTSGLPNDILLNASVKTEKYTDTLNYLKNEYLVYPPKTIYHYSNVGYCLLGHTIFAVSKRDYPDYMQKNIFRPVGMKNTGFIRYDHLQNISKAYEPDGTVVAAPNMRNIPAGGIYSNIDDMVKLAQEIIAIYHGKKGGFIKPQTLREIFREQSESAMIVDRKEGLGWSMFKNDSGFAVLHFGSDNVSNAGLIIAPEKKMAAIMLINTAGGDVINDVISTKFLESCGFNDKDHDITYTGNPQKTEIIELPSDALETHPGIYPHTRAMIEVSPKNKELMLKADFGSFLLKSVSQDEFIPCKVVSPEKCEMMTNRRFLFKDIKGYHILFWEDAARSRKPLAYKLGPQIINDTWKNRLGKYEIVGYKLEGKETFSQAEISVADGQVLQLKIFYTSGEYLYNLRIENDHELVFCGFDDLMGGETIQFGKDKQKDVMRIYGLTMKKTD